MSSTMTNRVYLGEEVKNILSMQWQFANLFEENQFYVSIFLLLQKLFQRLVLVYFS